MASHIFYPTTKKLKTPFTSYIEENRVVALDNYNIWIVYGIGQWALFNGISGELLKVGKFDGNIQKYSHYIQSPRSIYGNKIVFANTGDKCKLQVLDPFTDKYEDGWDFDTPTMECVASNERNNEQKMIDAINDIEIQVFHSTNRVVLRERRESNNADYLVTAFVKGSKLAQANFNPNQKTFHFDKADDSSKVLLYCDTATGELSFAIWDLEKATDGFINYSIGKEISGTIVHGHAWDKDTICLVGNTERTGFPEIFFVNYGTKEVEAKKMDLVGEEALLSDVILIDSRRKKVLAIEESDEPVIGLYNGRLDKVDFSSKYKETGDTFEVAADRKYFIEFDGSMEGEPEENKEGSTKLKIYSLVNKRMFVLFLMKHANVKIDGNKASLLKHYGNPYIAQQVAEMFALK